MSKGDKKCRVGLSHVQPSVDRVTKGVLFLNGECRLTDRMRQVVKNATYIFAADGGAKYALSLGLRPTLIIGDGDSLSKKLRKQLKDVPFKKLKQQKDFSDSEAALVELVKRDPKEIYILGALGGRLDHMLSNLFLLTKVPKNVYTKIISHDVEISCVTRQQTIEGERGKIISLFPLTKNTCFTTTGLKYTAQRLTLKSPSHGLSNEMMSSRATVLIHNGILLLIEYSQFSKK